MKGFARSPQFSENLGSAGTANPVRRGVRRHDACRVTANALHRHTNDLLIFGNCLGSVADFVNSTG